jgi:hypothetical protein
METININPTEDTPKIILDQENRIFEISGRSLPEDVVLFYEPIISWLDELEKNPIESMELSINLEYFNTASSKLLLDIFLKLEEIHDGGTPIKVIWHYPESDSDMQEAGEEYSEIVEIPFEIKED